MIVALVCTAHARPPDPPPGKVVSCESLAPLPDGGVCAYTAGDGTAVLLKGVVLGFDTIYDGGEVLIDDDGFIAYVGCSEDRPAELDPLAAGATTVSCPEGVVSPGLINAHNHTIYDWNRPAQSSARYEHRNDWRAITGWPAGRAPFQDVYSELRHAVVGTTSSVSGTYIAGTVLNLDVLADPSTGGDWIQWQTFPLESSRDFVQNPGACSDFPKYGYYPGYVYGSEYVPHVAEGINDAAHNEFACLSHFMNSGWTILHGIATDPYDGRFMAHERIGLVWTPRSNISLYANTAQVRMLSDQGVVISLGTDWSPTGSVDMKRELACADEWNTKYLNNTFSDRELWLMATYNPALSLGAERFLGTLEPGALAQVVVYDGRGKKNPYRAVIEGNAKDTVLVLVGDLFAGEWPQTAALYGDLDFLTTLSAVDSPIVAGCEQYAEPKYGRFDVCGAPKFVCTNRPEVHEYFRQLVRNPLDPGGPWIPFFEAYSIWLASMGLPAVTEYDLASFETLSFHNWLLRSYPLITCGAHNVEPTCTPSRPGEYDGTIERGPASRSDRDGDGITDNRDNCKKVFNPIRPMDHGVQPDADGDGRGDACDRCPLEAGDDCARINPYKPVGACCHSNVYADPADPGLGGLCEDWIDEADCLSGGGAFYFYKTCDSLDPACGNPGACCIDNPPPGEDPPGACAEELEVFCEGRFLPAADCSSAPFDPPCGESAVCWHSITMWDDYGDGWNSGYIDVYVNDELILAGVTLASGSGPETVTFLAEPGDTIETLWSPGAWPHEAEYCIYDSSGGELGCDGFGGVEPTGIVVSGYCKW
jgi:hypothetical protein